MAPGDFDGTLRRPCDLPGRTWEDVPGSVARDGRGRPVSFHDAAGGPTTLLRPTRRARAGRSGRKPGRLPHDGAGDGERGGSVVVGVTLPVSSLPRAPGVHRDAPGLAPPREARFDAGPRILTVRAERRVGRVADAARRGALRDTTVFRVGGLEAETTRRAARGVEVRAGAAGGRTASRSDPDGHRLLLRQAAADAGRSHTPSLERIAARGAASHETRFALEVR